MFTTIMNDDLRASLIARVRDEWDDDASYVARLIDALNVVENGADLASFAYDDESDDQSNAYATVAQTFDFFWR